MQFIMYWRLYPGEPYHTKLLVINSSNRLLHILIALHRSLQRGTCVSFWHARWMSMEFRLLDLCHSAFLAITLWDSIIVPYGDLDKLDNIPWYAGSRHFLRTLRLTHHKECRCKPSSSAKRIEMSWNTIPFSLQSSLQYVLTHMDLLDANQNIR